MNEGLRLSDIAGYCPEKAIWKMMMDLTDQLLDHESEFRMAPGTVMVAGDSFLIVSSEVKGDAFMAPEGQENEKVSPAEMVWTIGALIYYASTGRILFGGHGGSYQRLHPGISLPVLPKNHQGLTSIMQHCLCSNPSARITFQPHDFVWFVAQKSKAEVLINDKR